MKLEHVKTFVVVADELHFGRAAARLFMAQPAVSQHIKLLESDLGVQLFERSTRSVRLSERGRAFHGPAQRILEDVDRAERAAKYGHAHTIGRVTLGFSSMSSQRAVPAVMRAMGEQEPGIELVLQGMNFGSGLLREVAVGNLDVGIARLPIREPELDWHVYEYQSLVVALPEGHRLAERKSLTIGDLVNEPLVAFPAGSGSAVREATLKMALDAGFSFGVVHEAPDTSSILGLVAADFGISVTVSPVQASMAPGVVYRPLDGAVPHMAAAFFWKRHNPSHALQAFIEVMSTLLPTPTPPPERVFC
ncbi:LysR family transcriptional regulator [Rhodococcus koreensis]